MRLWYVIQVERGREEAMAELLNRLVPNRLLCEPIFYPQYETELKMRGRWIRVNKPLFSGYLIAVSNDPVALAAQVLQVPGFARLLTVDGTPAPLAKEEVEMLGGCSTPGNRMVRMSHAQKVGEKVVIVDGPLVGHEALIKHIDRHRSTAYLELEFCGRKVGTRMGLAVLSGGGEPAAHAAAVRRKAQEAAL